MEKNVGGYDRVGRWLLGGGLALIGMRSKGWKRWLALSAAGKVLATANTQQCLLNRYLGINTAQKEASV